MPQEMGCEAQKQGSEGHFNRKDAGITPIYLKITTIFNKQRPKINRIYKKILREYKKMMCKDFSKNREEMCRILRYMPTFQQEMCVKMMNTTKRSADNRKDSPHLWVERGLNTIIQRNEGVKAPTTTKI